MNANHHCMGVFLPLKITHFKYNNTLILDNTKYCNRYNVQEIKKTYFDMANRGGGRPLPPKSAPVAHCKKSLLVYKY